MKKQDEEFPPDLIDADEAIDLVIDAVLVGSKPLRQMTKKILTEQKRLRRAVDEDAWRVFLRLEEMTNARSDLQMQILVRWALAHGARSPR